ncbi:hypothetical protein PRVXT_001527 [Proteinivorax tanatarense]|uniref:TM2 domain-containing protein n=1 Tax=Proteinivorax tanatarense TaxID=1260629 RepID=A0AAU7VQX4_9FIRM
MRRKYKRGWSWKAFLLSVFWYFYHGIIDKAIVMAAIIIFSFGLGIIPVAIYSGLNGNKDLYNKAMQNF